MQKDLEAIKKIIMAFQSNDTVLEIAKKNGLSQAYVSKIWKSNFSLEDRESRKRRVKQASRVLFEKPIIESFHSDKSMRVLAIDLGVTRKCIGQIWKKNFTDIQHKDRTSKMNSLGKIGEKNHMYGKIGKLSPVYGKVVTDQVRKSRSERMMGGNNPSVIYGSPRKGVVLSEEIKEKIRQATIRQFAENRMPYSETKPEKLVRKLLDRLNANAAIQYMPFDEIPCWFFGPLDFALPNDRIAIEVQGDYFHANPEIYDDRMLNAYQIRQRDRDKIKYQMLERYNWRLLYIWENDLKDMDKSCEVLKTFISGSSVEQKKQSIKIQQLIDDSDKMEQIKSLVLKERNFRKIERDLNINRFILQHLNQQFNWIEGLRVRKNIYKCRLCDHQGALSSVCNHYLKEHSNFVNEMFEHYAENNMTSTVERFDVSLFIIKRLLEQTHNIKTHAQAMKERHKPRISNKESGAGMQKNTGYGYQTDHFIPEYAELERQRKETGLAKLAFLKEKQLDRQTYRRLDNMARKLQQTTKTEADVDCPIEGCPYFSENLTQHITNYHKITIAEYKQKYKTPLTSTLHQARRSKALTKKRS